MSRLCERQSPTRNRRQHVIRRRHCRCSTPATMPTTASLSYSNSNKEYAFASAPPNPSGQELSTAIVVGARNTSVCDNGQPGRELQIPSRPRHGLKFHRRCRRAVGQCGWGGRETRDTGEGTPEPTMGISGEAENGRVLQRIGPAFDKVQWRRAPEGHRGGGGGVQVCCGEVPGHRSGGQEGGLLHDGTSTLLVILTSFRHLTAKEESSPLRRTEWTPRFSFDGESYSAPKKHQKRPVPSNCLHAVS